MIVQAQPSATPAGRRLRRAATMVVVFELRKLLLYNFLTGVCIDYTPSCAAILTAVNRWTPMARLMRVKRSERATRKRDISRLLRMGFLLLEGSREAMMDEHYVTEWEWDLRAGLFHLSIKDPIFLTTREQADDLRSRVVMREPIALYDTNHQLSQVIALNRPDVRDPLFSTLSNRRTRRAFSRSSVSLQTLADCLFAGLGITGFIANPVKGLGTVPLKMTPSGGARNPFEAYVYARRITGLDQGVYHYSAFEHSLGRIVVSPLPRPSVFIADQKWGDAAAALVILVAKFQRTMWKYSHPMAYRAVLIEAGHIAQNIMITAGARGLSTVPTAALADARLERALQLNRVTEGVAYVVGLGVAATHRPDYGRFVSLADESARQRENARRRKPLTP